MAGFSGPQKEVAQDFTEAPSYGRAGPLARQALVEAGIVESSLRDAPHEGGNLDSEGALQQRASQGWGTVAQERNPTSAAEMFLQHAIPLERQFKDAGSLAQKVQGSAFPERYGQHAGEARTLLKLLGSMGGSSGTSSGSSAGAPASVLPGSTQAGGTLRTPAQIEDMMALVDALKPSGPSLSVEGLAAPKPTEGGAVRIPSELPQEPPVSPASLLSLIGKIGEDSSPEPGPSAVVSGGVQPGTPGYAPAGSPVHAGGALGGLLQKGAMLKIGRIDEGQDGQTNPGAPILANGFGKVVSIKSDPNGFGPSYPLVQFSTGPLAGLGPIYFGHTLAAVKEGQVVRPGDVISHTGTGGVGNATVPGWFEIGLGNTLGQGDQGQGAKIAPYLR